MLVLKAAIREERWDVAALCLLLGCVEVASRLPADTVVGLLEALELEGNDASPA